ncbi:MAG: response regulator, partial [Opitutales bacterium]
MNILFIEDERELLAAGMEQMEFLGHVVYPAKDLSQARAILEDKSITLHCIIADRNLPDGCGIKFLKEVLDTHPRCKSAIVSAHLTDANIEELKRYNIAYYLKPLLYSTVLSELLSKYGEGLKPVDTSLS